MTVQIREATSAQDYEAVSRLIVEYVGWLRARYSGEAAIITDVLDQQALSDELEQLGERYGPPRGRAFLAEHDHEVRGCVAYRRLDDGACEMKRLFVPQRFQGSGIGRALCEALFAAAVRDGYGVMKLDTGAIMAEAIGLYRSLGFRDCPPYADYPARFLPHLRFMERSLTGK
jgi:GNAT superfamily N-acetyltransferase